MPEIAIQMTHVHSRLLNRADLESYRRLRLECLSHYPDFFGDSYAEELDGSSNKFYEVLSMSKSNSFLFGAFFNNYLIGTCGFIQEKRIKAKHRGNLVQAYVDPSFAGKGIGSKLLSLTIKKAFENISIDQILLSVVYANDKAITLYTKLGFAAYGHIENYFKQGDKSWSQLFMVLTRNNYLGQSSATNGHLRSTSMVSANRTLITRIL
jgi:ribosomal protein S18 acetylase RimI-like enzyme